MSRTDTSVLIEETSRATDLIRTSLRALIDLALLVLNDDAEGLALGCLLHLGVKEALETLLLALESAEGLGAALGELSVELGVAERGSAEVIAVHLGILIEKNDD